MGRHRAGPWAIGRTNSRKRCGIRRPHCEVRRRSQQLGCSRTAPSKAGPESLGLHCIAKAPSGGSASLGIRVRLSALVGIHTLMSAFSLAVDCISREQCMCCAGQWFGQASRRAHSGVPLGLARGDARSQAAFENPPRGIRTKIRSADVVQGRRLGLEQERQRRRPRLDLAGRIRS